MNYVSPLQSPALGGLYFYLFWCSFALGFLIFIGAEIQYAKFLCYLQLRQHFTEYFMPYTVLKQLTDHFVGVVHLITALCDGYYYSPHTGVVNLPQGVAARLSSPCMLTPLLLSIWRGRGLSRKGRPQYRETLP